jgi:hypothetical protein
LRREYYLDINVFINDARLKFYPAYSPKHSISEVNMSLHSDTLSWFPTDQSLLLVFNATCLAEKQQIPIYKLLVWY